MIFVGREPYSVGHQGVKYKTQRNPCKVAGAQHGGARTVILAQVGVVGPLPRVLSSNLTSP